MNKDLKYLLNGIGIAVSMVAMFAMGYYFGTDPFGRRPKPVISLCPRGESTEIMVPMTTAQLSLLAQAGASLKLKRGSVGRELGVNRRGLLMYRDTEVPNGFLGFSIGDNEPVVICKSPINPMGTHMETMPIHEYGWQQPVTAVFEIDNARVRD